MAQLPLKSPSAIAAAPAAAARRASPRTHEQPRRSEPRSSVELRALPQDLRQCLSRLTQLWVALRLGVPPDDWTLLPVDGTEAAREAVLRCAHDEALAALRVAARPLSGSASSPALEPPAACRGWVALLGAVLEQGLPTLSWLGGRRQAWHAEEATRVVSMLQLTLRTLAAPLARSRRAERGACEARAETGDCEGDAEEPEREGSEEEDEVHRGERGERVPGWSRDCVEAVLPLLPQLLASATPLHLSALRCTRAIFAAVGHELPQLPPVASDAHGLLTAAPDGGEAAGSRTRALRKMHDPSRLRAMTDALHGPHVAAALFALAELVRGGAAGADQAACREAEALCCTLGQHLLPARSHAARWVQLAPLPALRLLLHCSRAQPALAAALATDGDLVRDLWREAALAPPQDEPLGDGSRRNASDADANADADADAGPLAGGGGSSSLLALQLLSHLLAHGSHSSESPAMQHAAVHLPQLARALRGAKPQRSRCAGRVAVAGVAAGCLAQLLRVEANAEPVLSALRVHARWAAPLQAVAEALLAASAADSGAGEAAAEALLVRAEAGLGPPPSCAADGLALLLLRLLSALPPSRASTNAQQSRALPAGRSGTPREHDASRTELSAPLHHAPFWRALGGALSRAADAAEAPLSPLSAYGVLALLKAAHLALGQQARASASWLLSAGLFPPMLRLLRPEALSRLRLRPTVRGGGGGGNGILGTVCLALYVPFCSHGEQDQQALVALQQQMYGSALLGALLGALPLVSAGEREVAVGLLSRLVLGSGHFAQQFAHLGGLQSQLLGLLLHPANTAAALTDALLILCHLARVGDPTLSSGGSGGEVHYRALRVSGVCERLPPLLQHREAGVRAKVRRGASG